MSPGVHLSHAARLAGDAQRFLISSIIHLEMADAGIVDLDELFAEVGVADFNVAVVLEELGLLADHLQHVADAYGHREVRRRSERRPSRAGFEVAG